MPRVLDRRTVLKCLAAVAASTAFGCSDDDDEMPVVEDRTFYPQSVASGDPRPTSVVIWTRAIDPGNADADVPLTVQVALDDRFSQRVLDLKNVTVSSAHDHVLKVKVTGLSPRTTYFFRFLQERNGRLVSSPVGRTRTAPDASTDTPVRFVVANCQDYNGRYYNTWQRLLQLDEDLDCVVFLGDYIYETTPEATIPGTTRQVHFSEPDGALKLASSTGTVLAAASLSNYRDLYKTYRSDTFLQQVHERYPFVVTWDDHEFSDDCWDAHANYTDGRQDEAEPDRRRNSEQAFFEYIPLDPSDLPEGPVDIDAIPLYPDSRIWRSFDFGTRMRLIVTDYRSRRPDHLIPEDAWPAAVAVDAATLTALGVAGSFTSDTFAYVDISAPEYTAELGILRAAYVQLAVSEGLAQQDAETRAADAVKGPQALAFVNPILTQAGRAAISPTGKPRGIGFVHMGKTAIFSRLGSRYVVVKDTFDVYAAARDIATGGEAEDAYGAEQSAFVLSAAEGPPTWKVLISSVSPTTMVWDLSNKPDVEPATVRNRYYFDVDQWDGFPQERARLLGELRGRTQDRTVVVAGDIHAAFASVELGVPALTAPAISSSSVKEEAGSQVEAAGFPPSSAVYRYVVTEQDATLREGNPNIAFVDTDSHGFTVVEVQADVVRAAYHLIPSSEAHTSYADQPEALASHFTRKDFIIQGGGISMG
ncbi:alkaline phosphatase D family protein [Pyxidicoccus parkwayensis]|uniref:Alkaline phosphatase D family protein n=1 Tax=Pyxidicoccus parkwayensis TaxID=2813578 RepID=A0ABX7P6G7_9BACT|nr:alkaline phosphatase D family protein [Pyxidicoccus parkwaysis]QSQ26080.1 alkaline phosphatase D family protein [Pyxidicoccus parkwaysis]